MKCDENEGCPIWGSCSAYAKDEAACHLTPSDITIISAMIAGEWRCSTCIYALDDYCDVLQTTDKPPDFYCNFWELREDS